MLWLLRRLGLLKLRLEPPLGLQLRLEQRLQLVLAARGHAFNAVMCFVAGADEAPPTRQLIVYCPDAERLAKLVAAITALPRFGFAPAPAGGGPPSLVAFAQGDVTASRKQVAPALQELARECCGN